MNKLLLIIVLILVLTFLTSAAIAETSSNHWLLYPGEDGYILCADGRFDIEINGDDSIRVICVGTLVKEGK